ncbi:MAG TPA: hypothetical protein VK147_01065 [Candidatus Didemnitutus sp.]|nr:hypothetical protein [Candidatus Didemnitutus sp.]
MKKQNVWTAFAVTAFAALSFGLTACSENGVTPEDPMGMTATSTSFDLNASPLEINDATMEMMMSERPDPNKGRPVRNPFMDFLRRLNLTERQQAALVELQTAHHDCVSAALAELRAAEKAIIEAARAEAEAIKQQVADGTLTRDEARTQLRAINQRVREALKALPGREEARAAMKICDETFIAGVKEILTEEQLAKLERWLATRKGGGHNPPPPPHGGGRGDRGGHGDSTGAGSGRG